MIQLSNAARNEFARALRLHKYERAPTGILFPHAHLLFGGVFGASVDGGPMVWGDNSVTNECINAMLNTFFTQAAQPTAWYMAPFSNNLAPTNALTAATFTATQGEYTGYVEVARQVWTPNGASTTQVVQNSNAAATFTVGTTAVTLYGAALLSASAKSATTGVCAAAGLFGTANALNPGSKITTQYALSASAA